MRGIYDELHGQQLELQVLGDAGTLTTVSMMSSVVRCCRWIGSLLAENLLSMSLAGDKDS
jgi:hypothetical protein